MESKKELTSASKVMKDARTEVGLSQVDFANATGLNINTVLKIEQGITKYGSLETWEKVEQYLEKFRNGDRYER